MKFSFKSIGPAIIVTAVVLGPGSILTSSKVGASFGLAGLWVIAGASALMIGMVALAAKLGVEYKNSLCTELADRLGRPMAIAVGSVLFVLVALFQSSNNLALIGGLEPLLGLDSMSLGMRVFVLVLVNFIVIAAVYVSRDLYKIVESAMKLLVGIMSCAFLANFVVVLMNGRNYEPVYPESSIDWLPLLAMIGTTFSVAGAFFQSYLVKQKGWGPDDVEKSLSDSVMSITILGTMTAIILMTAWRVFYGNPAAPSLSSVGEVARQLEPLFGSFAMVIFSVGILAGGVSSFLVNALIGGTVFADSLNKGSSLSQPWPRHLTVVALLVGMTVALASLIRESGVVYLITFAQALTVLGIPVLALSLVYLGTRPDLTGPQKPARWILGLSLFGFAVSCFLAYLTALRIFQSFG